MLVYGAGPRGHVDGGTERTLRDQEAVERVGGVRPKYWVPRERIRTQPVMCLVDGLVQVLYAFLQGLGQAPPCARREWSPGLAGRGMTIGT